MASPTFEEMQAAKTEAAALAGKLNQAAGTAFTPKFLVAYRADPDAAIDSYLERYLEGGWASLPPWMQKADRNAIRSHLRKNVNFDGLVEMDNRSFMQRVGADDRMALDSMSQWQREEYEKTLNAVIVEAHRKPEFADYLKKYQAYQEAQHQRVSELKDPAAGSELSFADMQAFYRRSHSSDHPSLHPDHPKFADWLRQQIAGRLSRNEAFRSAPEKGVSPLALLGKKRIDVELDAMDERTEKVYEELALQSVREGATGAGHLAEMMAEGIMRKDRNEFTGEHGVRAQDFGARDGWKQAEAFDRSVQAYQKSPEAQTLNGLLSGMDWSPLAAAHRSLYSGRAAYDGYDRESERALDSLADSTGRFANAAKTDKFAALVEQVTTRQYDSAEFRELSPQSATKQLRAAIMAEAAQLKNERGGQAFTPADMKYFDGVLERLLPRLAGHHKDMSAGTEQRIRSERNFEASEESAKGADAPPMRRARKQVDNGYSPPERDVDGVVKTPQIPVVEKTTEQHHRS